MQVIHTYHLLRLLTMLQVSKHARLNFQVMGFRMQMPKRAGVTYTFLENGICTGFKGSY